MCLRAVICSHTHAHTRSDTADPHRGVNTETRAGPAGTQMPRRTRARAPARRGHAPPAPGRRRRCARPHVRVRRQGHRSRRLGKLGLTKERARLPRLASHGCKDEDSLLRRRRSARGRARGAPHEARIAWRGRPGSSCSSLRLLARDSPAPRAFWGALLH